MGKCSRCEKGNLEKKDYGQGVMSFCNHCQGFFNQEGEFIEEGAVYYDARYKRGYWGGSLPLTAILVAFVAGFLYFVLKFPWYVFLVIVFVPVTYAIQYYRLKKKGFFKDSV